MSDPREQMGMAKHLDYWQVAPTGGCLLLGKTVLESVDRLRLPAVRAYPRRLRRAGMRPIIKTTSVPGVGMTMCLISDP